jgi:hypothetical protein
MTPVFASVLIGLSALVVVSLLLKRGRSKDDWPDDFPDGWA